MDAERVARGQISRRTLILGAAAGLVGGVLGTGTAQAAPVYTPIPKLPYEVSRTDTRYTAMRGKPFECIDVVLAGDRARIYVPWATPPRSGVATAVVWFYHSNGSTSTALDGAYNWGAMMAVEQGAVCICPDFGGSLWTSQTSLNHQANWSRYVTNVFAPAVAFARANSGGGPLMSYAYGTNMVPRLRGMYLANAAYDMEDLYARDPFRIGPVYGHDSARVRATNPARLPESSWSGKRLKTVVSTADFIVPPDRHGLALAATAQPVAADVRIQYHDQGHTVPGWTQSDMITTFNSWL